MEGEPDFSVESAVEKLKDMKPEKALGRVFEIVENLRVPSPETREDAVEILKTGYVVVSKLLRAFGNIYPEVEKMDVLKAQGFRKFTERLASFSEKLSRMIEELPEIESYEYLDIGTLEMVKEEIASLVRSGEDIGPDLKIKAADIVDILENVPDVPKDYRRKSEFFKSFSEFSEKLLELLEIMTFIKKDVFSLDTFFDEKLEILISSDEFFGRLRDESTGMVRDVTLKTAAVLYTLSKRSSKDAKKNFKKAYKRFLKEIVPKLGKYGDMKRIIKRAIKDYANRSVYDILKDFSEDLGNVLSIVRQTSNAVSALMHECIESSGRILSSFVLSTNEANVILQRYTPLFERISKEMLNFDNVAFRNIVNKNLTTLEMVRRRIELAKGEVNRVMDEIVSNRKNLEILDRFYGMIHSFERDLETRKNRIDQALRTAEIYQIVEKLKFAGDDIASTALILGDFFGKDFDSIRKISEDLASIMKGIKSNI